MWNLRGSLLCRPHPDCLGAGGQGAQDLEQRIGRGGVGGANTGPQQPPTPTPAPNRRITPGPSANLLWALRDPLEVPVDAEALQLDLG